MAISVTRSRVKEKCGISDTSYDSTIDNLIAELVPVITYQLSSDALADSDTGVQSTLNLGATEIVCGELLAQRFRELGTTDTVRFGPLQIDPGDPGQAFDLIRRGYNRLAPFLGTGVYEDDDRVSVGGPPPTEVGA